MITCDDTGFDTWLPVPSYSANTPNPLKEFCKPTRDLVKGIIGILCEKSADEICLSACRCSRCHSETFSTECDRRCYCLRQALPLPATGVACDRQRRPPVVKLSPTPAPGVGQNAYRKRLSPSPVDAVVAVVHRLQNVCLFAVLLCFCCILSAIFSVCRCMSLRAFCYLFLSIIH